MGKSRTEQAVDDQERFAAPADADGANAGEPREENRDRSVITESPIGEQKRNSSQREFETLRSVVSLSDATRMDTRTLALHAESLAQQLHAELRARQDSHEILIAEGLADPEIPSGSLVGYFGGDFDSLMQDYVGSSNPRSQPVAEEFDPDESVTLKDFFASSKETGRSTGGSSERPVTDGPVSSPAASSDADQIARVENMQLIAASRGLELDHEKRFAFMWNEARPLAIRREREKRGTPVERVDLVLSGSIPFLQIFPTSRGRFVCLLRATMDPYLEKKSDADAYVTVGALGDLVNKDTLDDYVASVALYAEVLQRGIRALIPGAREDPGSRDEWRSLVQQALNNVSAGTMTYLREAQVEDDQSTPLVEKTSRLFDVSIAMGLRNTGAVVQASARRSLERMGLFAPGTTDESASADSGKLVALDRRCMIPALSGMGSASNEAIYLEYASAVARLEIRRMERVASGMFNAGVSLLRVGSQADGRIPHRLCRMLCNAAGIRAAMWSANGEIHSAIVQYDGDDCLVNLAGAAAEYARSDGRAEEIPRLVRDLGRGISSTYAKYLERIDKARIDGSVVSIESSLGNPPYQPVGDFGGTIDRVLELLASELAFSDPQLRNPASTTEEQRGEYLAAVSAEILRLLVETDRFTRSPRSDEETATKIASVKQIVRDQIESDWRRSENLESTLLELKSDLEDWFGNQRTGSRPYPDFLKGSGIDGVEEAWGRVTKWLSDPAASIHAAFEHLGESIRERHAATESS